LAEKLVNKCMKEEGFTLKLEDFISGLNFEFGLLAEVAPA
jgi:hypothetical protein